MTYARRPIRPAVVGPRASRRILHEMGDQLERLAVSLAGSPHEQNRIEGRELVAALALMREAARELGERRRDVEGSDNGTTEHRVASVDGGSSRPPRMPAVIPARVVASRNRVSPSYVTRLCRDEVLEATKPGREWLIDAGSVSAWEAARRPVA